MPFHQTTDNLHHDLISLKDASKKEHPWARHFKNVLNNKPWILVIGPQNSGKTSFLKQANLTHFHEEIDEDNPPNIWYNAHAVFIELPALDSESTAFLEALQLLKKFRSSRPFDGIILTLSLATALQDHNKFQSTLIFLQKKIEGVLGLYLKNSPMLTLAFTHMDKVAGFCDFFSFFQEESTQKAFGCFFDAYQKPSALLSNFEKKYNRLLNSLQENLIPLLHKLPPNINPSLIREFPQQFESLRSIVRTAISSFANLKSLNLNILPVQGVFFTSNTQSGICIDRLANPIAQTYQFKLSPHSSQIFKTHPYFISGLIKLLIKAESNQEYNINYSNQHKKIIASVSGVTAFLLSLMVWNYHHSVKDFEQALLVLNTAKHSTSATLNTLLPEMSNLLETKEKLHQLTPWWFSSGNQNMKETEQWVSLQYQKDLTEQFLPNIMHSMESILLNSREPMVQYTTLKAYLMLDNSERLDINTLKNWLNKYQNLPSTINLDKILLLPLPRMTLNTTLISHTRESLNTLPLAYLAYLVIKNETTKEEPFASNITHIFQMPNNASIPTLYLRKNFETLYNTTLAEKIQTLQQNNWVLNTTITKNTLPVSLDVLKQVQKLYLEDYQSFWKKYLQSTSLKTFTNLKEAEQYFELLAQTPSPFQNMLDILQNNIAPFENPSDTQEIFNAHIASSLKFSFNEALQSVQTIQPILKDLNHYFHYLSQSSNPNAYIFETVKQKFTTNAQGAGTLDKLFSAANQAPLPIKNWALDTANNTWGFLLHQTQIFVNQRWQTTLLPIYQKNIAGHFPIVLDAEPEISLSDFTEFFSPQGLLSQFFEQYIHPFLNTTQAQWTVKKAHDLSLPLSASLIQEFERANVMREMFFPQNSARPMIHFTLQPLALQPIVAQATLDIQGITVFATQARQNQQTFTWPSQNSDAKVTLHIQSITGERFDTSESGLWAWFRLLSQADIQPATQNPATLQIVLDLNGNGVQYLVQTDNPVNPFTPDIIQAFKLPNSIY